MNLRYFRLIFLSFTLVLSSYLLCQKTLMYLFQSGGLAKRLVGKFSVELALSPPVSQAAAISQTPPSLLCSPLHCWPRCALCLTHQCYISSMLCWLPFIRLAWRQSNPLNKMKKTICLVLLIQNPYLSLPLQHRVDKENRPWVSGGRWGHEAGRPVILLCAA